MSKLGEERTEAELFSATFSKLVLNVRQERETIKIEKVKDCWLTDQDFSQKGRFPFLSSLSLEGWGMLWKPHSARAAKSTEPLQLPTFHQPSNHPPLLSTSLDMSYMGLQKLSQVKKIPVFQGCAKSVCFPSWHGSGVSGSVCLNLLVSVNTW